MVEHSEMSAVAETVADLPPSHSYIRDNVNRHARRLSLPLLGPYRDNLRQKNNVNWSKSYTDLACEKLPALSKKITVATTGPGDGIKNVTIKKDSFDKFRPESIGRHQFSPISEWTKRHVRAYGMATSLYEYNQSKHIFQGDPVADVYAIVARPNSCILSIADGVNWGEKSRLAARCAVAGSVQYLHQYLSTAANTHEVMQLLLQSFELAQECIIKEQAAMTTLCTAVVCEIKGSDEWALCMVNVGDSLGYVYNKDDGAREVTVGSHVTSKRDMRCPGGSLGPVDGYNPDLRNLTFSYTRVRTGDIVFLTSDGVSDNFDPVVSQCNHCQGHLKSALSMDSIYEKIKNSGKNGSVPQNSTKIKEDIDRNSEWDIPSVRHQRALCDMQEAIEIEGPDDRLSAKGLCANLLNHVCKSTNSKRRFLERVDKEDLRNDPLRRIKETEISRVMKELPGKLDHAGVVAFEVGEFPSEPLQLVSEGAVIQNKGVSLVEKIKEKVHNLTQPQSPDEAKTELVNLFTMPA